MSEGSDESGFNEYDGQTGAESDADTDKYDFQMDMGLKIELDENDKIDMFESKTPSNEYQDYVTLMLRIALLAFDIPYSFFNSKESSYSASKQDRADYELSASHKRASNIDALENIADWVLPALLSDIEGAPEEIDYEFIPQGTPWIDELKEVQAAQMRISAGISNRTIECKKKNLDFTDINELAGIEEKQIKTNGVSVVIGQPGQALIGEDNGMVSE